MEFAPSARRPGDDGVILDSFPAPTLEFGPREQELRERIREWIEAHDPGPPPEGYKERIAALTDWQRMLSEAGFVGLAWPRRYGGGGLDEAAEAVLAQELATTDMGELINRIAVYMVGPSLMELGSEEQRERFLPGMLDASELWCQGFSEPEAGSDLAAVRTFARREGDELVLNGHKVWTSRAGIAHWCAALVRTDRDAERHHGLSMAIVDMNAEGVEAVPLPQLLNEPHFNEVFFDDVRVPVTRVIGGLGDGWAAAMSMLSYERGLLMFERGIRLRRRFDELVDQVQQAGLGADQSVRERLGAVAADLTLVEAQAYRTLAARRAGTLRAGATSVDKLLLSRAYQRLFAVAVDVLGSEVARTRNEWTHDLLESRGTSIYGGTTEIQLNIVARQVVTPDGATPGATSDPSELDEMVRSIDVAAEALLPVERLLAAAAEDRPLDDAVQRGVVGLGWSGAAVPEALGGLGLDSRAHAALAAVAGRRLLPAAIRGEAFLLAPLLATLTRRDDTDAGRWLEALLAGELRGGGAVIARDAGPMPLHGKAPALLTLGPGAALVACVHRDRALLIDVRADPVRLEEVPGLDPGQRTVRLHLDGCLSPARVLSGPPLAALRRTWSIATAAEAFGAGQRALELAVDHAREREQFGRPIGSFQAVEHLLARARVELEGAEAALGRLVAAELDGDPREALAASVAHAVPAAARAACETSIQVHGGMGFTWELGLHLYYRRVLALQYELCGDGRSARAAGESYLALRGENRVASV
jgi:alkylation response protein AidB-like acyl-CoA dehydrogenase